MTTANATYQGMLQRLGQMAVGAPAPVPMAPQVAPAPVTMAAPVMGADQLALSGAAQGMVYAPYPVAMSPVAYPGYAPYPAPPAYPPAYPVGYPVAYPAPPQAPFPQAVPPMAVQGSVIVPAPVVVTTTAPTAPPNPLGVAWVGAATPAPPPQAPQQNPLGVDWVQATPPAPAPAPTPAPTPAPVAPPPAAPQAAPAPENGGLGARAVAEARKYLGVPYVWGGSTPKGFDCSGLMQYVFRSLGVSIPRVAADQFKAGSAVSRSDLRPGDAVFFKNTGSRTGITHVGMYLGDGKFLHAPKTGDVVKISNLDEAYYRDHYAGARRYG